jgi:uncharacterized membrane protein YGL010W
MRTATELLVSYARYHRDRRNIATHLVGVPMIIFAVTVLLAQVRHVFNGQVVLTLAWATLAVLAVWWVSRHVVLGVLTTLWVLALSLPAHVVAAGSMATWLGWGLGLFFVGWLIQFIGHYYEGRKPAFVDDITGLVIAPFFLTAEVLFAAGWNKALQDAVESEAGPLHVRDLAHPVT